MGKGEKQRKSRLDKGESGEFIGFGAFANLSIGTLPTTATTATTAATTATTATTIPTTSTSTVFSLSPVYTGSDEECTILFPRIGQKRDAITKTKALGELSDYFQKDNIEKKQQVEALRHWAYLYHSKLHYDSVSSVRAASVICFQSALARIPKAWNHLVQDAEPEILGMLICSQADPAAEVRQAATPFVAQLFQQQSNLDASTGVWKYVQRILSYGRPMIMYQALFARKAKTSTVIATTTTTTTTTTKASSEKKKSSDNQSAVKSGDHSSLSSAQLEELEERFERIVGTTLSGFQIWLVTNVNNSTISNHGESVDFLFKYMASPKAQLRRKTYSLIATCCQKAPLLLSEKIQQQLATSVSSEKEASNLPTLLETLLAYLAHVVPDDDRPERLSKVYWKPLSKLFQRGVYGASASQWAPTLLPFLAMMKPHVNHLVLQQQLLSSVWQGREHVIGTVDTMEILTAVSESATYLLLVPTTTTSLTTATEETEGTHTATATAKSIDQTLQTIATCWIQALGVCLMSSSSPSSSSSSSSSTSSGPAVRIQNRLCSNLAREYLQLELAATTKPTSGIFCIQDWFWQDSQSHLKSTLLESSLLPLATWLQELQGQRIEKLRQLQQKLDSLQSASRLTPILREMFHTLLQKYQGKSGLVPNSETYQVWLAILQYTSASSMFPEDSIWTPISKFWMNDLLRWMVIHTSSLSEQKEAEMTKYDFTILKLSAPPLSTWESMLKELIAAHCDMALLAVGLVTLLEPLEPKSGDSSMKAFVEVSCPALEQFCVQVARDALVDHHHNYERDDEELSEATELALELYRKTAEFLQTCVGLGELPEVLVGKSVVQEWVECACSATAYPLVPSQGLNPVLETLVLLVKQEIEGVTGRTSLFTNEEVDRILLESWRQGGDLWQDTSMKLLYVDLNLKRRLIDAASNELQANLAMTNLMNSEASNHGNISPCWVWSERAYRVLNLCVRDSDSQENEIIPLPSLKLVGLGTMTTWQECRESTLLSQCLLSLLEHVETFQERLAIIENSTDDSAELVVKILISISGADTDPLKATAARIRQDDCAKFLSMLGGRETLSGSLVECWFHQTVTFLARSMQNNDRVDIIAKGVAVLSQIVELVLLRVLPEKSSYPCEVKLDASSIKEEDTVWYISDMENPESRDEAKVVKIHRDIPAELYFTIRLEQNDETQERQTVVDRLRKTPATFLQQSEEGSFETIDGVRVDAITEPEISLRRHFVQEMMDRLVKPFSESWPIPSSEILNIMISQCGIFGEKGLGTMHYDVFQLLARKQGQLKSWFDSPGEQGGNLATMFWELAYALGYGCNTQSSKFSSEFFPLDPTDLILAIVQYHSTANERTFDEVDQALSAWLVVASSYVGDTNCRGKLVSLLFRIGCRLLEKEEGRVHFHLDHFLALRAIRAGQLASYHEIHDVFLAQGEESEAIEKLLNCFAAKWEDSDVFAGRYADGLATYSQPLWNVLPYFPAAFDWLLRNRTTLVAAACRRLLSEIVKRLFVESKRWYCLRLLDVFADAGNPIYEIPDNSIINAATATRLQDWAKKLSEEESEELEDDVAIAAQWFPTALMNEIESWQEENKDLADTVVCGRMSVWLALLRIVDVATSKDAMNRPSLLSYINHCHAVDTILNTALRFMSIGNDRKAKPERVTNIEEIFGASEAPDLSKLASLILFRTIEVFPTLSKHWWEMECPKYFTQAVNDFVESNVSPEILRRELDRIRKSVIFGDMSVKGSPISREVIALYVQDDFTLTVVIKIPLSFPFRRAEVDCSKTLGVPESRWKRWALQITLMLNNQGGTLQDALMLWKENVDKEFDGVEPCPVCYSVLHVKTHKLPELECKTCHNRFHVDCLHQWFRSSGKSACVLCQQPWSGTRV